MNSPEPDARPPLQYAARKPNHRRHFIVRVLIVVAIGLGLGQLVPEFPILWHRAQLLYWQRQCLQYSFSPNQVVLDLSKNGPSASGYVAPPWQALYGLMSSPGMRSNGTVFLHELISSHEHRRLVAIDIHLVNHLLILGSRVIIPGDLFSNPKEMILTSNFDVVLNVSQPVRVFGGIIDPNDPSHFTFAVDDGANHDYVNGWLENGDHIRIEFQTNASTQPVPATGASSP